MVLREKTTKRVIKSRTFKTGDLERGNTLSSATHNVAAKLAPKFSGLFRVEQMLSPLVYKLMHQAPAEKIHI